MKTLEANLDATLSGFRTDMAGFRTGMAELTRSIERRNAELIERVERRDADGADRMAEGMKSMATATDRMATTRWWQTAVMAAVAAVIGAIAGGLPALVSLVGG